MAETTGEQEQDDKSGEVFSVHEDLIRNQTESGKLRMLIGPFFSSSSFFVAYLATQIVWVLLNVFGVLRWDPYPFAFLSNVASIIAPLLSLLLLMNQKYTGSMDEIRSEMNLQLSLHMERVMTMNLRLLREIEDRLQIESREDPQQVRAMADFIDPERLMANVMHGLQKSDS